MQQAKDYAIFDAIKSLSPAEYSAHFKIATQPYIHQARGGGFYLWKPWCMKTISDQYPDGTVVVYADAGCSFNPNGKKRMDDYLRFLETYSCIRFQMPFSEEQYTTVRTLEYLQADENSRKSGQYLAGIQLFRLCTQSRFLINRWYELAVTRPDLFSDVYNAESRAIYSEFQDHRHDQSIFSVLTKLYPEGVLTLRDETHVCAANHDKPILATRIRY